MRNEPFYYFKFANFLFEFAHGVYSLGCSAFDKVSQNELFSKYINREVAKYLMNLAISWNNKQQFYIV